MPMDETPSEYRQYRRSKQVDGQVLNYKLRGKHERQNIPTPRMGVKGCA